MRDYGTINTQFWIHPVYSKLSVNAKLIAVYLLTCPHTNMLGCFRLPIEYIAVDLSLDKKSIQHALQELMAADFLSMDIEQGWILIHPFLEWNPIENGNQAKHIIRLFEKISSHLSIYPKLVNLLETISEQFGEEFRNRLQTLSKGFRNSLETLSEPFRNQEQEQNQKQKQEQNQEKKQEEESDNENFPEITADAVIHIPLSSGEFPITLNQINQWETLYPGIDVLQTLRNIRGWNLANPKRRKTKSGVLSHINTWLAKEQNQGSKSSTALHNRAPPYRPPQDLNEYNARVSEQWIRESERQVVEGEIIK